jgi:hypothetical protein
MISSLIHTGQNGTGTGFSRSCLVFNIPQLLYIHLSPPHEVSDSPDQAAHYHTPDPKLESPSLTWHLAGLGVKVV